jgi:hypothetical protein
MSGHIVFSSLLGIKKHKFHSDNLELQLGYFLCEKSDNEFFNYCYGIDPGCANVLNGDGHLYPAISTELVFSDECVHE